MSENDTQASDGLEAGGLLGQLEAVKRPRGRPRKIRPGEAETPATQVSPVAETSENPIRVGVEEVDALTGDVIAVHDDAGDEVELPPETTINVVVTGGNAEGAENDYEPVRQFSDSRINAEVAIDVEAFVFGAGGGLGSYLPQLDHDHDGHPGGSLPRARLTDLQVAAYTRDLMDAYMGQHEVKRADGWNRVWTMRHEIVRNHDNMLVRCARGPLIGERLIPASQMSNERAEEAVRAVDQETER